MKKIILAAILGAASLAAVAQTTQADESVPVPGRALKIELPARPLQLDRDQNGVYRGTYTLSNGQMLHLRQYGSIPALYAEIDEQGPRRLVAAAPSTFVALDRSLKISLDLQPNGDASGEVLMQVPEQRMADGRMSQAKVVSATVR